MVHFPFKQNTTNDSSSYFLLSHLDFKVIVKSIEDPEDNYKSNSSALMGSDAKDGDQHISLLFWH